VKFRRQRIDEGGINLTPLIDVVFLLLIFFMVSTSFTKESRLQIELPTATGEPPSDERAALEIVVDGKGQYRINERAVSGTSVDALMTAMTRLAEGGDDLPVIITADATSPHQAVVTAMDAAGRLGFARLSLTTQKPQGAEGAQ
jgi:biopolymer transport protein ExbD